MLCAVRPARGLEALTPEATMEPLFSLYVLGASISQLPGETSEGGGTQETTPGT